MIEAILKAGTLGRYVEAEDVAGAVVRQLTSGYAAQVHVPRSLGWTSIVRGLPVWMQERVRDSITVGLLRALAVQKEKL